MDGSKRVDVSLTKADDGVTSASRKPKNVPADDGFRNLYRTALNNATPRKPKVPPGAGRTPTA